MKHFKNVLLAGIFSLVAFAANAQADELMLVEYVDWNSGSGLAVKIYNPSAQTIDLSDYQIQIYNNGNTSPNSTGNLSGSIGPGASTIASNGQYATACSNMVDIVLSLSGVNDEDVVTLARNGEVVDAIGAIGYTGNYQINGTVINQSLKWVKLVREEFNCTRYTQHDGLSPNSWPTNPGTNLIGWNVLPVSCLDPAQNYNISNPIILLDTAICAGDSLLFNNQYIGESGTYSFSSPSAFNCDTIWELQLQVLGAETTQASETICPGDSIFLGGGWQSQAGTYTDTVQNPNLPCQSLLETTVSFYEPESIYTYISICEGDSALIEGSYISSPGTYSFTEPSGSGPCLTKLIYELHINETRRESFTFAVCESYTYNGQSYSASTSFNDTLLNAQGCDSLIMEINILIQDSHLEISAPAGICQGHALFLEADASQAPLWNTGDTSFSLIDTPLHSQWYWAEISNGACSAYDSVYVEVSNIEIAMDSLILLNYGESASLQLAVLSGQPSSIQWTPEDASIDLSNPFRPEFSPEQSTLYIVTASDVYGCTSTDTVYIEIIEPKIVVPNVITPNKDGFNDLLIIEHLPERNSLQIYNRWGREVFNASPYENDWDGSEQDLTEGQYSYVLSLYFGERRLDSTGIISLLK